MEGPNKFDKDLEDVVYFRIERTMRRVKAHTRKVLKAHNFGVTIDQWITLKRLSEVPDGISQMELAASTFKDPAAITRILDHLVKKELVLRQTVAHDRRTLNLQLSEKGWALVRRMTPHVQAIRQKGVNLLSSEEAEDLKSILDKIYHSMEPE
ncbi:MAG: MarR family transcriptional regulator [Bacteroidota bacterium]